MTWDWFFSAWCLGLEQRAADFWIATPWEFWTLFSRKFQKQMEARPLTRADLKAMMEKYPDGNNDRRTSSNPSGGK